jgi:hypothetical protein
MREWNTVGLCRLRHVGQIAITKICSVGLLLTSPHRYLLQLDERQREPCRVLRQRKRLSGLARISGRQRTTELRRRQGGDENVFERSLVRRTRGLGRRLVGQYNRAKAEEWSVVRTGNLLALSFEGARRLSKASDLARLRSPL